MTLTASGCGYSNYRNVFFQYLPFIYTNKLRKGTFHISLPLPQKSPLRYAQLVSEPYMRIPTGLGCILSFFKDFCV